MHESLSSQVKALEDELDVYKKLHQKMLDETMWMHSRSTELGLVCGQWLSVQGVRILSDFWKLHHPQKTEGD